jgi:hypothetical protein
VEEQKGFNFALRERSRVPNLFGVVARSGPSLSKKLMTLMMMTSSSVTLLTSGRMSLKYSSCDGKNDKSVSCFDSKALQKLTQLLYGYFFWSSLMVIGLYKAVAFLRSSLGNEI